MNFIERMVRLFKSDEKRGLPIFQRVKTPKTENNIQRIPPGRYPMNCNPVIGLKQGKMIICGKKFKYTGEVEGNKFRVVIKDFAIKRHVIAYGPFLLIVDSTTDSSFIEVFSSANEAQRVDDNIPFTRHTFKINAPARNIYYDGYFLYIGDNAYYNALFVPNLGSMKKIEQDAIEFDNGRVFINNIEVIVEYDFNWNQEDIPKNWRVW